MAKQDTRISDELLDELLGGEDPAEAFRNGDLLADLRKAVAERALDAEMRAHLEGEREAGSGNHRNGHNRKRVLTDGGAMDVAVPRDREGRFEPRLIEKHCRRLPGFDDKVISMYARRTATREIRSHVEELYGLSVSRELISKAADAVRDEVRQWQSRPLEETYAIMYFDAVRVKIRDEGLVRNKAVYLAIGISCAGRKEVLGLWIEQTEGAKFWLSVMNELKARGVGDVPVAVVDGLKGFPEAIGAVYPEAVVQTCIVHLLRYSLAHGSWKERRALAADLRPIPPGADRSRGRGGPGRLRGRPLGPEVPGDRAQLAQPVGGDHPVSGLLGTDPAGDLHDQRDRELEQHGAPGGADPEPFPERPGGRQADLPGPARRCAQMEEPAEVLAGGPRRVLHPVRRPVPDAAVVNPVRPGAGNAAARLASTRFAGPTLRFGPSGDPSRSAAYRLAMAVRGLTATAGRRGRRRASSTTGLRRAGSALERENGVDRFRWTMAILCPADHGGRTQTETALHTEFLTVTGPLDSRHPARHNIWTPVLEGIQSRLYASGRKRLPTDDLYVRNAIHDPSKKPCGHETEWPALLEETRELSSLFDSHAPKLVFSFGAFAFEFSRRGCGESQRRAFRHWTTEELGREFRLRMRKFAPQNVNLVPLLHVSIARGQFLRSHKDFTQMEDGNYFDYVGQRVADCLLGNRAEFSHLATLRFSSSSGDYSVALSQSTTGTVDGGTNCMHLVA